MKNQSGISLLSLVIVVVVMLILSGTAIYNGIDTLNQSRRTAFISEVEMVQAKVNVFSQKGTYENLGKKVADYVPIDKQLEISSKIGVASLADYKYFDEEELKKMDLEGIKQKFLINFSTRDVVSITGVKVNGILYYRPEDFDTSTHNVKKDETKNKEAPSFSVTVEGIDDGWKMTVSNIQYASQVGSGTVEYKLDSEITWRSASGYSFIVYEAGNYDIRLTDSAGNSTIQKQHVYVPQGLILNYDGQNNTGKGHDNTALTWKDLSISQNDAVLQTSTATWEEDGYHFTTPNTNFFESIKELPLGKTARTVEYVVRLETSGEYNLFGFGTLQDYKMADFRVYQDGFNVHVYSNLANEGLQSNLQTNTMYSNTFKYSNLNAWYRTGANKKEYVAFYSLDTASTKLMLGKGISVDYNNNPNFKICSLRIYNRFLTEEEVQKNYELDKTVYNAQ